MTPVSQDRRRRPPLGLALIALGLVLGVLGTIVDGRLDAAHLVPLALIAVVVVLTAVKRLRRRRG